MTDLLNTRAVSDELGIPKLEVVRRIRKGDIKAQKWGWNWAVEAAEVERVREADWYRKYQRKNTAA